MRIKWRLRERRDDRDHYTCEIRRSSRPAGEQQRKVTVAHLGSLIAGKNSVFVSSDEVVRFWVGAYARLVGLDLPGAEQTRLVKQISDHFPAEAHRVTMRRLRAQAYRSFRKGQPTEPFGSQESLGG